MTVNGRYGWAIRKLSRSLCERSIDRSDCPFHDSYSILGIVTPHPTAGDGRERRHEEFVPTSDSMGHRRPRYGAQKGRTVSSVREEGVTKQNDREACASIAPTLGKSVALGWSPGRGLPSERFPNLTRSP